MPSTTTVEVIKHGNSIPWHKIPDEVKEEMDSLASYTKETGNEGSITICKKPDKTRLFVGSNFQGNKESTLSLNCDARFGKSSRIGSAHSHPSNIDTVGVLASEPDLFSTMSDSYEHKRPMIDCITSPDTPLIPCMSPKDVPTRKKIGQYERALDRSFRGKTDSYFLDNVRKDFDFALFDRYDGTRDDNAPPKKIIKAAFGRSNKVLRERVKVFERGAFCEYVADLMGQHNRDDVVQECRKELKKRSFLGLIDLPS